MGSGPMNSGPMNSAVSERDNFSIVMRNPIETVDKIKNRYIKLMIY